jgi:hypothetical protein
LVLTHLQTQNPIPYIWLHSSCPKMLTHKWFQFV